MTEKPAGCNPCSYPECGCWKSPTPAMVDKALNAWFASPPSETDQGLERSMRAALEAAAVSRPALIQTIEAEARRYAGMYPQSSDGRNTFIIFADWVASLGGHLPGLPQASPLSEGMRVIPAPRGGMEHDWQHWSLVYQKRQRALMKLICKEGYAVHSDSDGMPYKLEKSAGDAAAMKLAAGPQQVSSTHSLKQEG